MFTKAGMIALTLCGAGAVFGQASITCSSNDMKRHYCNTDTRGGVQMTRQRSGSACRQGYSWGYDRQGIWVDHGCRADFVAGGGNGRYNDGRYGNGAYNRNGNGGSNRDGEYRDNQRRDRRDDRHRDKDDRDRNRDHDHDNDHDRDNQR